MNLIIKDINNENYNDALNLKVRKDQEGFIETIEECLDEAKRVPLWRIVGIYCKSDLIGFAMYGLWKMEGD